MNIRLAYHWQPLTAGFSLWFEKTVDLPFVPRIGDGLVDEVGDETGIYTVKETSINIQTGKVECWVKDDEMSDDRNETIAKFLALGWKRK